MCVHCVGYKGHGQFHNQKQPERTTMISQSGTIIIIIINNVSNHDYFLLS